MSLIQALHDIHLGCWLLQFLRPTQKLIKPEIDKTFQTVRDHKTLFYVIRLILGSQRTLESGSVTRKTQRLRDNHATSPVQYLQFPFVFKPQKLPFEKKVC